MVLIDCRNCKRKRQNHSKGLCTTCYKKILWKPKKVICEKCKRERPMHAKGFCQSCYVSTFHLDKIKAHNVRKMHNLDYNTYRKITKLCVICNFDKIVDIHHLDHNHQNNSQTNLIGICPNHHKMIHDRRYQKEIFKELKEKGFDVPELPAKGFLYKEKT